MKKLIIVFFVFFQITNAFSQKNEPLKERTMISLDDGSKFYGKILGEDYLNTRLLIVTGDTINIPSLYIKKQLDSKEVFLYKKGKCHFKSGWFTDISLGSNLGGNNITFNSDISYNKRINQSLDVGGGIGAHTNSLSLGDGSGWLWINVTSIPMYVQGKYYLNNRKHRLYATARAGYVNNTNTWQVNSIKNGALFQGGVGFTFASKNRVKHYLQISQYALSASGTSRQWDFISGNTFDAEFNVWFTRIMFTYGINIGN